MTDYAALAKEARRKVLTMIHKAQTSHIASNFSVIDIATVLYENLKPEDEVVWSKGWASATIYYFLAKQGKIPVEDLEKFPNHPYIGLAEVGVPGIHVSGGSMGQGLGVAIGMALARKREGKPGTIYCIVSDGEHQEGTMWEGALMAGQKRHQLDNLVVLIDYNKWTAMGRTEDVANLEPLKDKWKAFGWSGQRIDGHDHNAIKEAIDLMNKAYPDSILPISPKVIICDTIKGKGVKEFEDKILYHYAYIDDETYEKALAELQ